MAEKKCGSCGWMIPIDARVCPRCGSLEFEMRVLPPEYRTRGGDPDTSFTAAASVDVSASALKVLRIYGRPTVDTILDYDAYQLAFTNLASGIGARCADLRRNGLIERTGEKAKTPSGRAGYLCRITEKGRAYLRAHPEF
jgi:hypothetical protein